MKKFVLILLPLVMLFTMTAIPMFVRADESQGVPFNELWEKIADIIDRLDDIEVQIDELEQGSSGISGYEIVEKSIGHSTSNNGRYGSVEVSAPAGKKIIGGGASSTNPTIVISSSYPKTETTWRVDFNAIGSGSPSGVIRVYAICANVEP